MQEAKSNKPKLSAPQNFEMARMAERALDESDFETEPGMCQRFNRQVIQRLYGKRYNKYFTGSAIGSMKKWAKSPFAHSPSEGSVIGDILFYSGERHSRNGHVAIRIEGNKVAENSSVHRNGKNGGKGTRPLSALGTPSLIVRLPRW